MEEYDNELLDIANDLAKIAERIRAVVIKKQAQSAVQGDAIKIVSPQDTMSIAEFRKVITPYYKLDKEIFQRVLGNFNVKAITEVNADDYNCFIKILMDEFKGVAT